MAASLLELSFDEMSSTSPSPGLHGQPSGSGFTSISPASELHARILQYLSFRRDFSVRSRSVVAALPSGCVFPASLQPVYVSVVWPASVRNARGKDCVSLEKELHVERWLIGGGHWWSGCACTGIFAHSHQVCIRLLSSISTGGTCPNFRWCLLHSFVGFVVIFGSDSSAVGRRVVRLCL